MPFNEEVDKVAAASNAITSRWKIWAMAGLFILAVAIAVVAVVKFFF